MMASTSMRESLLPGRSFLDGRQGPDRQPHQQRVEADQPALAAVALQRQRVFGGGPQILARQRHHLRLLRRRDVDAPLALVDLGVLEDVDQLQRLAEQPRSRAQEIGGRAPPAGD